jgi:O-methyltransferase
VGFDCHQQQQYHARAMAFPDLTALKDFAGWKAARAPHAVGPTPDAEGLRAAYLDVLKLALCDLAGTATGSVSRMIDGVVASRELRGEDRQYRAAGMDWPLHGLTMVGLNRLDDLQACVESVCRDGVEGDVIEAGTWRGGASIFMRAALDALGETGRTVYVADSFQGFPVADEVGDLNTNDFLAVPADEVREHFARFGLSAGVELVEGFFEETLPSLTDHRWAIVRLDGDTYEATRAALDALYPRLAVGGYVIVDDFGAMEADACRRAVEEFRGRHGITEPIVQVDWTCVRWRRESGAPIEVPAATPPPATRAQVGPRIRTPHVPTGRERDLEYEVVQLRNRLRGPAWRRWVGRDR